MNPLVVSTTIDTMNRVVKKVSSYLKMGDADGADGGSKTPRDSNKDVAKTVQADMTAITDPTKLIHDLVECLEEIKVPLLNFDKKHKLSRGFVYSVTIVMSSLKFHL